MGEMRLWQLSLHVDQNYPRTPPTLRFQNKINMDCVDAKGNVRGRLLLFSFSVGHNLLVMRAGDCFQGALLELVEFVQVYDGRTE
jgi:hypothetical protein